MFSSKASLPFALYLRLSSGASVHAGIRPSQALQSRVRFLEFAEHIEQHSRFDAFDERRGEARVEGLVGILKDHLNLAPVVAQIVIGKTGNRLAGEKDLA